MLEEVQKSAERLESFFKQIEAGSLPTVERLEVCDYALVSAWVDHWPSRAPVEYRRLLQNCRIIHETEPDRFIKQRRIFIARLAEWLKSLSDGPARTLNP